ncbi:hypothetical protein WISP_52501 [Willisornis vidua]|uniref:Uncharacterized protein n=1 Tax=Willisornis vidua TaxID=1566151 RepID=A0ABQ9DHN1_9PASS|nr:hypothetical protein WISP_52501 [Willisornis vidua]
MFNNSLHEEIPRDVQSEPIPMQLEAMSCCPVTGCLEEETNPHLGTKSFQVVVDRGNFYQFHEGKRDGALSMHIAVEAYSGYDTLNLIKCNELMFTVQDYLKC